jgi:predicted type IV restriction endonuclease
MERAVCTDPVFRLGWLKGHDSATEGIALLKQWIGNDPKSYWSEADTRPIVEAMLRGLGWDTLTGDVTREGNPKIGDFHLWVNGKIAVLIEAKPVTMQPQTLAMRPFRQLVKYVETLRTSADGWINGRRLVSGGNTFVYAVLTTGKIWWTYDFTRGPKTVNDRVINFNMDAKDSVSAGTLVSVLGKESAHAEVEKFLTHDTSV